MKRFKGKKITLYFVIALNFSSLLVSCHGYVCTKIAHLTKAAHAPKAQHACQLHQIDFWLVFRIEETSQKVSQTVVCDFRRPINRVASIFTTADLLIGRRHAIRENFPWILSRKNIIVGIFIYQSERITERKKSYAFVITSGMRSPYIKDNVGR